MNLRENYLRVMNHEKTGIVPSFFDVVHSAGFGLDTGPWFEKGPRGGGRDGFGVNWVTPESGSGAPIPEPGYFLLDDITEWKEKVTFPDVDAFDWEEEAGIELQGYDPENQVIDFGSGNGVFERLSAMMGFENALMSLAIEPEACYDFMSAITDYKIKVAEKAAKYIKPDFFTNYDDIATERNLFMSPNTYRELIKPHHKRLNDALINLGIKPIFHCCGKAEGIIEDMIDCGYVAWTSVQPTNDIPTLLQKYGNKITLLGGYNTNGEPGRIDAPVETVVQEVRRCFRDYGEYPGYVFFGFKLANSNDVETQKQTGALIQEAHKCSLGL